MLTVESSKKSLSRGIVVVFTVFLTGCATPILETTADWFVRPLFETSEEWFLRMANDPDRLQFKYCASSALESESSFSLTKRGVAHMTCATTLDQAKSATITACENTHRNKCKPVYYFERDRGSYLLSSEQGSMYRKAAEQLSKLCSGYGFKPQTVEHSDCVAKGAQGESQLSAKRPDSRNLGAADRAALDSGAR